MEEDTRDTYTIFSEQRNYNITSHKTKAGGVGRVTWAWPGYLRQ